MSTIETGGPAFPAGSVRKSRPAHDPGGNWVETDRVQPLHQGLTMRDYFAAAAMSGGLEQGIRDNMDATWWRKPSECAKRAYAIADAMLAARKERP